MSETIRIGVLGLQGDVEAHCDAVTRTGQAVPVVVRDRDELAAVAGLILPGGESTTIGKLLDRTGLGAAIAARARSGMPIYGTCAGMILLATAICGSQQPRLGLMDIEVERNAFGRQVDSFEADIAAPRFGATPLRGVFIRAPYVRRAGPGVEVLASYETRIVAVEQGRLLATAFHPELTGDLRVHAYFVRQCLGAVSAPQIG